MNETVQNVLQFKKLLVQGFTYWNYMLNAICGTVVNRRKLPRKHLLLLYWSGNPDLFLLARPSAKYRKPLKSFFHENLEWVSTGTSKNFTEDFHDRYCKI